MELTARGIQERRFSTARRGYDKDEVHAFLTDVGNHLSHLEEELAIAGRKAETAKRELDSLNDVLENRLAEAHAARAAIIEEAEREAESLKETATGSPDADAARRATAIISEAEAKASLRLQDADRVIDEANATASRIVREAESTAAIRTAEADRLLDEARHQARRIRTDAERERSDIGRHVEEVRRILTAARDAGADLDGVTVSMRDGSDLVIDLTTPDRSPAGQESTPV